MKNNVNKLRDKPLWPNSGLKVQPKNIIFFNRNSNIEIFRKASVAKTNVK